MLAPSRLRAVIACLGAAWLALELGRVHRWFASPFAVWVGWDEAYITALAGRMIDGRWLPYVDGVSHRGPMLYWLAAIIQSIGGSDTWGAMRLAAVLFAELTVVLLVVVGVLWKRPLAGFVAAATFVMATTFGMEPKDGIGFNGELVATPLVVLATLLTLLGIQNARQRPELRIWLAAAAGLTVCVAGLTKQIAMLHVFPLVLWWLSTAIRERVSGRGIDLRPTLAMIIGVATPLIAVLVFYARSGHVRALLYYFFTYNARVYLGPVTPGLMIESSYLFSRDHAGVILLLGVLFAAAFARWIQLSDTLAGRHLLAGFDRSADTTVVMLHMLLALGGAVSTFRFWDHYFITVLPWLGLLIGIVLEEFLARTPAAPSRATWAAAAVVITLCATTTLFTRLTVLWLDGQRVGGWFGDPGKEPLTSFIETTTQPQDRIFVWGFASELYTSAHRRPASRFVYTTFVAGMVPWFPNLTLAQEDELSVPGSRDLLLRELEATRPELIIDVPTSIQGRTIVRYRQLADYLQDHYCYEVTIPGRNERTAHIYRRLHNGRRCERAAPPAPP